MRRTAALIVGGGPAGSAVAIRLQRAGGRPLLLERDAAPADALCGGFLSWRTLASLERVGIDAFALGAHPVARVRVVAGGRTIEAPLPARAAGLSRLALDAALIARVHAVERGVTVREAAPGHVRLDDGGGIDCDALFLATGKHELRGLARPRAAAGPDPTLGVRLRLAAGPALARAIDGVIELHLFDGGYAGLVRQEDGTANLCMAVHRSRLAGAGGRPAELLDRLAADLPLLGERIAGGTALSPPQAMANIPYGWRATGGVAGLFRLGDQAGVIPSLAGEGMGIALASAARAAETYAKGGAAAGAGFQPALARQLRRPLAVAGLLRRAAERPDGAGPLLALVARAPWLLGPLARLTRVAGH